MLRPDWLRSEALGASVALLAAACGAPVSPTLPSAGRRASMGPEASGSAAVAGPWQLGQLPDAATIANVADLVARPGRIVAVGSTAPIGGAIAWSSVDSGSTWTAETMPADGRLPGRAVAWGDRVLAVGAGEAACAHPFGLQTWMRDDSGAWVAAPQDPIFCAGGTFAVAAGEGMAVIVGSGTGDVPFAWSSGDGLHWTDRSGPPLTDTAPRAVAADDLGFVAFGGSQAGPWVSRSRDGTTWGRRQPLPGDPSVVVLGAIVQGNTRAVAALGTALEIYTTADPEVGPWSATQGVGIDAELVSWIRAVDSGIVALGGGDAGPRIWVSADGASWRAVDLPDEASRSATLTSAAIGGDRAFVSGQTEINGVNRGVIWSGPAALLAP